MKLDRTEVYDEYINNNIWIVEINLRLRSLMWRCRGENSTTVEFSIEVGGKTSFKWTGAEMYNKIAILDDRNHFKPEPQGP